MKMQPEPAPLVVSPIVQVPFLDLDSMHAEIRDSLDAAWCQIVDSNRFIGGESVERFEAAWASYCETTHAVGLSSGTSALELSLAVLGIGPGDEVILPTNTFIATASAVASVGARPVFVDVDPHTLLIDAASITAALSPRTAAVIVVHLYGQPADMDAINDVAARAGIVVIEDAAQAHGATWRGRKAGSMSAVGCFSFYPGKNLGAFGDAGAIVTNDATLARRIRSLANHGRAENTAHSHLLQGGNHRLDGLQAAVLLAKLPELDRWNALRREAAAGYAARFSGLPLELPRMAAGAKSSHHLAVIRVACRDQVREWLAASGIATGIHYPVPCHRQPAFAEHASLSLPVAELAAGEILSLPMYPHLGEAGVARVAHAVARCLDSLEPRFRAAS